MVKLNLSIILWELGERGIECDYRRKSMRNIEIQKIRMYHQGAETEMEKGVIYLADAGQIIGMSDADAGGTARPCDIVFFVTENTGWDEKASEPFPYDLCAVKTDIDAETLMNYLLGIQEKYSALVDQIRDLTLRDEPLSGIFSLIEPYLRQHFIVYDSRFDVLAYSHGIEKEFPEFTETLVNGYCAYDIMREHRAAIKEAETSDKPVPFIPQYDKTRHTLLYAFKDRRTVYAQMMVYSHGKPPEVYGDLACFIFEALKMPMQHHFSLAHERENFPQESLLYALLQSRNMPPQMLTDQLKLVGKLPLHGSFSLAVVRLGMEDTAMLDTIIRDCKDIFANAWVIAYNSDMIVLKQYFADTDVSEAFFENEEQEQTLSLLDDGYVIGVSRRFDHLQDLPYAYDQACRAISAGEMLSDERIFYYRDYAVSCYLCNEDVRQLELMISPRYRQLREYDKQHHTNYVAILANYISNNCNASLTGSQMFLHRNTIMNAIDIIEDDLGIDVKDFAVRQDITTSYQVEKIINAKAGEQM